MKTVVEISAAQHAPSGAGAVPPVLKLELTHDARHVRRKVFDLEDESRVLIDLPQAIVLHQGDILILNDGTQVGVLAAHEDLYEIRAESGVHLAQLAWHIGNRHLAAEIGADSIRILRDHVIKAMLENLGAQVLDIRAPFVPVRGAYSGQATHHHHHSDTANSGQNDRV